MDIWTIYLVLDFEGIQELISFINAVNKETNNVNCGNSQTRHIAVVCPPSFLKQDDQMDISVHHDFYAWVQEKRIICSDFTQTLAELKEISDFPHSEDSDEFLGDCINHLADEIPFPGSCFIELCAIASKVNNESFPSSILSALKRLEIWNHACFYFLSNFKQTENESVRSPWLNHIDFHCVNEMEMISFYMRQLEWQGRLSVQLKQNSGSVEIGNYYLERVKDSDLTNESFFNATQENEQLVVDTCLQLVALIEQCDVPLHYVIPVKFHLCNYKDNDTKDPMSLLTPKGCWWLGILKYDCLSIHKKNVKTTYDWEQFILQDFTHYLACEPMQPTLTKHAAVLITYESTCSILYFLRRRDVINSEGYLELLSMSQEKIWFGSNNPDEWCEKLSWDAKENISKVSRSIARCKSDDFFINGIAISVPDTLKQGVKRDAIIELLEMFDENGCLKKSYKLQSIPVISDCLLKNMKSEEHVKGLTFDEAKHLIGHGIEYCVDTFSAVRLDSRLSKVQKKYIPDDTINLSSFIPTKSSVSSDKLAETDDPFPSLKAATDYHNDKGKESRSQRHKRRLKILVEGVVQKYGHLSKEHKKYALCCKALFQETLNEAKSLKSSKGLNEQMKLIAKNHLEQILVREGCQIPTSCKKLVNDEICL